MARQTSPPPEARRTPMGAQLLAFAGIVVLLAGGVFAWGRIGDEANVAMALTAAWFAVAFVGAGLLALRRRELLIPLGAGYGLVAVAVLVLVALPTLRDKEVDERVVTGTPAAEAAGGGSRRNRNVQLASGSFQAIAHPGSGTAAVVELPDRRRMLTLTDFETDSGPDLRLYVSTSDPATGDLGDFEDLGALKGNVGDQQYELPAGLDLGRYGNVVVWCRAFSVGFTSAPLRPS